MLTREQILKAQELKTKTVNVPEWGGEIILRQLSSLDRFSFLDELEKIKETKDGRDKDLSASALFVVWTAVDKKGNRIFHDSDVDALTASNPQVIQRLVSHCGKLNGFESAEDAAGN